MPRQSTSLALTLETLYWVGDPIRPQKDDFGFNPGLWPVFFKIDGATAAVSDAPESLGKLVGTATVQGTTGTGKLRAFLQPDRSVPIPEEIGQWLEEVQPIPVGPRLGAGPDLPGIFGVAAVAFDPGGLEADALEAGHAALNQAVQDALNDLIASLGPLHQEVSDAEIDALVKTVQGKVDSAVHGALDFWDKVKEKLFDLVWFGSAVFHNTQDDLSPHPLDQKELISTFPSGTVGWIGVSGAYARERRTVGQGVLSHFESRVRAVAGYSDDTYQHAIVATADGGVSEIWWQGPGGVGQGLLSHFQSAVTALAGFYSPDGYHHVIVAAEDRSVTELWWQGAGEVGRGALTRLDRPIAALAGYSSADGYQNVIAATDDGGLTQLWWQGGGQVGQGNLGRFTSPVVDVAGYFAPDGYHHVIVATKDGGIAELFWQGPAAPSLGMIARVEAQLWNGPVGVGAYYSPQDYEQHVVVGMSNGTLRELHWTPNDGRGVLHDDLAAVAGLRSMIDAYCDPSGYQHAIAATESGDVVEAWWITPMRFGIHRPPVVGGRLG
jgi:hypothetical protein